MAMSSHEYKKKSESQRYVDTLREEYISKHLRVLFSSRQIIG